MQAVRWFWVTALLALALVPGCGGGDNGGTQTGVASEGGAKVFADAGCGDCHTLKAAGATGTTGPNLDELRPNEERVARQVRNGGGGMPAFEGRLSDQEIQDVAAFVSQSAGG